MTGTRMTALLTELAGVQDPPAVFVESGTYHGKTTRLAVPRFREVHTIEISPPLYDVAVRDLTPLGVRCHFGNASDIVPHLAVLIAEPAFWYLDAHWFKRTSAPVGGKEHPLPLWDELRAIAQRPYADIIVVDDVHSFGKSEPTPEWEAVSLDAIAAHFPGHRAAIRWDQACVWKREPDRG